MINKSKINCAVIGYGAMHNFGKAHAKWIDENPYMHLYGICDSNGERLEQAKSDFPGIKTFRDVNELFSDAELDMVTLVTPNFTHKDLAIQAFSHGKHVLTENAMCLSTGEATEMIDAADRAGKMLCVHHNRRHDGNYRLIKEIVDSGEIGEIFHIELSPAAFQHPFPNHGGHWWADKEKSGGTFYYYGPQAIDWILDLVPSKIKNVTGFSHKLVWKDMTNEDQVRAIIRFENDVVADFVNSHIDAFPKPFWRILGTKGAIVDSGKDATKGYEKEISYPSSGSLQLVKIQGNIRTEETLTYKDSDWQMFYRDIAAHILYGKPVPITGEVGRRVIGVIESAKKSCITCQSESVLFK